MAEKKKPALLTTGAVAENRRARYDYEILDTLEAGIVLTGTEVKSLRQGKAQITERYASPEEGELWLINAHIPEYLQANRFNHAERRRRKLLVSRRELASPPTQFWSTPSSGISSAPGWTVGSPSSQSPPPRKRA